MFQWWYKFHQILKVDVTSLSTNLPKEKEKHLLLDYDYFLKYGSSTSDKNLVWLIQERYLIQDGHQMLAKFEGLFWFTQGRADKTQYTLACIPQMSNFDGRLVSHFDVPHNEFT